MIHLTLMLDLDRGKLSKCKCTVSFQDLTNLGYLPEAIINYIVLLGQSPNDNQELFLGELKNKFKISGLSKYLAIFDLNKLHWIDCEYIKDTHENIFFDLVSPCLKDHTD